MQPTVMKSNRSYSEFFTSGFRAMTNRRRRMSNISTVPVMPTDSTPTTNSTQRNSSFHDITNRRARPTSMIASPFPSTRSEASSSQRDRPSSTIASPFTSTRNEAPSSRRDRRSSLVTFSTWLFERKRPGPSDNYLSFSSSPPKNKRELHGTSDVTEVWITAGGPFTPASLPKSSNESVFEPIDPFASSPDSKSFFIDLSESPPSSTTTKRESFLSFTTSSPDRSFLRLPFPRRRERPTSVQTMPIPTPSRSRRSSYYSYHFRPPSWNKSDSSWILTEENSRASTPEPLVEDVQDWWSDPALTIDWRQFHVELLRDEA